MATYSFERRIEYNYVRISFAITNKSIKGTESAPLTIIAGCKVFYGKGILWLAGTLWYDTGIIYKWTLPAGTTSTIWFDIKLPDKDMDYDVALNLHSEDETYKFGKQWDGVFQITPSTKLVYEVEVGYPGAGYVESTGYVV